MKAKIIIECDFGKYDEGVTAGALRCLAEDLAGQVWDWNDQCGSFSAYVDGGPKEYDPVDRVVC